ncbi:MAG: methionyl-tRNA formyltransferase [Legionella sp.]|nr:MAG: methionyl-tRNA formyltransferase [Legionella sp.]PJD98363.1 MAG: methionyl-tRNA formyltransferase [Legionella sp.]
MKSLNIVFAGTPEFGLPCLNALMHSAHNIKAVYTQPDRPSGRGRKLQASAVKSWALEHHIPIYQPLHFKAPETRDELAALQPDLMIVIAYGLILPQAVLDIPRLGCVNVHASLLPQWRGASPIQHAILHGDIQSGVTIMQMDVGMDTGAMLTKVSCPIHPTDTAGSLHDRLAQLSAEPLIHIVNELALGQAVAEEQDHALATYTKKINKEDGAIDWHNPAVVIDRQIRAFNPWPVAYTTLGSETIRIHQAKVVSLATDKASGTILSMDKNGMMVATGEGGLLIELLQFAGGKVISVADWLNTKKTTLQPGLVLQ